MAVRAPTAVPIAVAAAAALLLLVLVSAPPADAKKGTRTVKADIRLPTPQVGDMSVGRTVIELKRKGKRSGDRAAAAVRPRLKVGLKNRRLLPSAARVIVATSRKNNRTFQLWATAINPASAAPAHTEASAAGGSGFVQLVVRIADVDRARRPSVDNQVAGNVIQSDTEAPFCSYPPGIDFKNGASTAVLAGDQFPMLPGQPDAWGGLAGTPPAGVEWNGFFWIAAGSHFACDLEFYAPGPLLVIEHDLGAGVPLRYFPPQGKPMPAVCDTNAFATCP